MAPVQSRFSTKESPTSDSLINFMSLIIIIGLLMSQKTSVNIVDWLYNIMETQDICITIPTILSNLLQFHMLMKTPLTMAEMTTWLAFVFFWSINQCAVWKDLKVYCITFLHLYLTSATLHISQTSTIINLFGALFITEDIICNPKMSLKRFKTLPTHFYLPSLRIHCINTMY